MSLEQAIAENTSALKQLIGVWTKLAERGNQIDPAKPFAAAGVSLNPAPVAAKVELPKPEATPAPTPVAAAVEVIASPTIAAASPSEPISYATVSKAITDMVKVDKTKVIATLAAFGVSKGPQLTEAQYADFLAALAA